MGETAARLESLSDEARQASLTGNYPGFWVADQAPVEDASRRDGQRGEGGTIRNFGPARESAAMFGFVPDVSGMSISSFKPTILVFNGKQESFSRWKQESVVFSKRYGFDAMFTRADEFQDVNVEDSDCPMESLLDEFGANIVVSYLNTWQLLSLALKKRTGTSFLGLVLLGRMALFG